MELGPGVWVQALFDVEAEWGFAATRAGDVFQIEAVYPANGTKECGMCGESSGVGAVFTVDKGCDPNYGRCPCTFRPILGGRTLDQWLAQPSDFNEPVKGPPASAPQKPFSTYYRGWDSI